MLLLRFAPARVEWSALGWQTDLRTLCRDVNMYPLSSFWFAAAAPCGMGATIKTEGAYRLGEDQECWRYFRSIAFRTMVSFYPPVLFQPVSPRSTCTRRVWKRAPQRPTGHAQIVRCMPRRMSSFRCSRERSVSDSVSLNFQLWPAKFCPSVTESAFGFRCGAKNCRASDEEPLLLRRGLGGTATPTPTHPWPRQALLLLLPPPPWLPLTLQANCRPLGATPRTSPCT